MMPADVPGRGSCYLPDCPRGVRWKVTDTNDENGRDVCDEHLPRLVDRTARKIGGDPVVVAPLGSPCVEDAARLYEIGATVYGLVSDTEAARVVDSLSPEMRGVLAEVTNAANDALRAAGRGPVVDVRAQEWVTRRNRLAAGFRRLWRGLRRSR